MLSAPSEISVEGIRSDVLYGVRALAGDPVGQRLTFSGMLSPYAVIPLSNPGVISIFFRFDIGV